MASPAELSLDYKPPNGYTAKQLGDQQQPDQSSSWKIQEFLVRLEEERRKIDAFKRELPLCMQLINNAMEYYKEQQQLEAFQTNQGPRPVLEEFMPLKHESVEGTEKAVGAPSEKAGWMISAQLWSTPAGDAAKQQAAAGPLKDADGQVFDVSPKLALDAKQRNGGSGGGGAFQPFSKEKNKSFRATLRGVNPELALVSFSEKAAATAAGEEKKACVEVENGGVRARKENGSGGAGAEHGQGGSSANEGQAAAPPPPTHRKTRRCWSPDLHRRFVNALQILGGSQVATPKQIRELMKVDGLTNDEVKSHLQKYRLHTRRPAAQPQAAAAPAPHLMVLGGIWIPPEYATSAAAGPAIYAAAAPVPQDHFYRTMPQALQQHHHFLPHPPSFYCGGEAYRAKPAGSPESEVRSGGDHSTESIEEEEGREEREEEDDQEEEEEEEEEDAEGEEEKAAEQVTAKAEDVSSGGGVALKGRRLP